MAGLPAMGAALGGEMVASSDQNEADFSASRVLTVASHCASVARMVDSISAAFAAGRVGCAHPSSAAAGRSASARRKNFIAMIVPSLRRASDGRQGEYHSGQDGYLTGPKRDHREGVCGNRAAIFTRKESEPS